MSAETKHTPGPWHNGQGPHNRSREIFGPSGWLIADCRTNQRSIKEEEANARLIAAAPEMLEALLEALKVVEIASRYCPKSIKNTDRFSLLNIEANSIRAAIAKAEGGEA